MVELRSNLVYGSRERCNLLVKICADIRPWKGNTTMTDDNILKLNDPTQIECNQLLTFCTIGFYTGQLQWRFRSGFEVRVRPQVSLQ